MSPIPDPSTIPPTEQGRLAASDGVSLAWYRWDPAGRPRGTICLFHGHGEHAGRYGHVARAFAQAGWVFLALDARGHGRSDGKRGHASIHQFTDDYRLLLRQAPARPCIAYGHSMGGLVVLHYGLSEPSEADAVIATGPWLRLAFPAPALKVFLGRTLGGILPSMTLATGLEQAALSRDPAVVAAYAADPLIHDQISFRLGIDILDGGEYALAEAGRFRLPLLIMHGADDRIIDPKASELFFNKAGSTDKTFRLWPGSYHEIHNDLDWEKVVEVSTGWARAHAG